MRYFDQELRFSASDIADYLDCPRILDLNHERVRGEREPGAEDAYIRLIQEKGIRHERRYLEALRSPPGRLGVIEIDTHQTWEAQLAATRAALASGADIVYQAALSHGRFFGYADFLRRVERPSRLGAFSYEVVDTKLAHRAKARYLIQLTCYSVMLVGLQGSLPRYMHVVTGDSEQSEHAYALSDYLHYYRHLESRFLSFMNGQARAEASPRAHCLVCAWRPVCEQEWIARDHLCRVANITKQQIRKLATQGLNTLAGLAQASDAERPERMQQESFAKLKSQARLQWQARETGGPCIELLPVVAGERHGLALLPPPDAGDLFFDMEGDPLHEGGGLEYLFGVTYREAHELRFKAFWALNRAEEKQAFEAFVDFAAERLARYPNAHIYHYAAYEQTALKKLMSRHGTREAVVDDLLRRNRLVDLYRVVQRGLRASTENYSIKSLECFYLPKQRNGAVTQGGDSIVWFERYLGVIGAEEDRGNPALLRDIEDYNRLDCESTYYLRKWLWGLRPQLNLADEGAIPAEAPQPPVHGAITRWEQRLEVYRQALLADLPKDPAVWTAEQSVRSLMFQLLDFHRRASKPQWWKLFDRRDNASLEDLLADPDCLAGLNRVGAPVPEGRSLIHEYAFPEQASKLRAGDACLNVATLGTPPGAIHALDEDALRIRFRVGAHWPLPDSLAISAGKPIDARVLRESLCRFADALIEGGERYRAVRAYLHREPPAVRGHRPGSRLIDQVLAPLPRIIDVAHRLDDACLFIQGPPGTGKTYTGSHLIVALLQAGRKVGVASNSHKAINNLLHAVEQVAREAGFRFRGAKKSSGEEQRLNGRMIRDIPNNDHPWHDEELVAGTAWLFSRPEFDQSLDYLFVDEAGQVAVANLVAMGLSARNIVLLGDQMQLGQPIQSDHPGDSGLSVLEYLLGGQAVIPPERGIFLASTWRLHPDLCDFISAAVYDGQLHAAAGNERQILNLDADADPALRASGLSFVPVDHAGCSQKSSEEADRIKALYESLRRQRYRDREGVDHAMTMDDILVLSPWNMQVNLLRRVLPVGARVGTVDKFQGQEAPVVIVSMATSSAEELPRDIEFLFSRNRLNVSLSRAKSLAILVASPDLLNVPCGTPEQMALVNLLCWVREVSDELTRRRIMP